MKNQFSYQTSEKIKIDYEIASRAIRMAAYAVDFLIIFASFWVLYFLAIFLFIGGAFFSALFKSSIFYIIIIIFYFIIVLFFLLYPFIFELWWKGQTPGKRILHTRAVNDDGSFLTLSAVILRNIFRLIDMLPFFYLIGFIVCVLNKRKKRIGDFVAGTIVIKENIINLPKLVPSSSISIFKNKKGLKSLFFSKEKQIIEKYIQTKNDIYKPTLLEIEKELILIIQNKTKIKKPSDMKNEDFIMDLYNNLD